MASLRSNYMVVVMVAAAVAAAMLLTVSGTSKLPTVGRWCPAQGVAVYPYWSWCWNPAVYYGHEVYELAAGTRNVSGSLAPEYDESNSTYYLRLADVGAKYKLTHLSRELRFYVQQSDDVIFVNVESGRALGWRQEGEDEFFLVETDDFGEIARLQFATATDVPLACIFHLDARCEAYHIVTFSNSTGLSAYEEDGATYLKQGSDLGLPFLLLRSTYNSVLATSSVLAAPA